ncbi:DUF6207 family protein [Streptomyces sp. NPDC003027]
MSGSDARASYAKDRANEQHIATPGLAVLDITAPDEDTVRFVMDRPAAAATPGGAFPAGEAATGRCRGSPRLSRCVTGCDGPGTTGPPRRRGCPAGRPGRRRARSWRRAVRG